MTLLFKLLSYCALPLILAHLVRNCVRDPSYRVRIKERFGFVPTASKDATVWFHAVSAGEVIAVAPLIENLVDGFPNLRFLVTTTTPTGAEEVNRRLDSKVTHFFASYDLPDCVTRFVRRQNPAILILVETELWPNLIGSLHKKEIPIYLVNARLSAKSFRNYSRFRKLTESMLNKLSGVSCQYEDTAQRFKSLGAKPDLVATTGSIKFDLTVPERADDQTRTLKKDWVFDRHVLIAASTHPREEEVVLNAYGKLLVKFPDLFLVLVPRHPPRTQEVEEWCREYGYSHRRLSETPTRVQVLIVDQMGVLFPILGLGHVVFIGGSLEGTGGHNPIEPAVQRVPMLMGPDRHNFEEVCHRFEDAGALETVHGDDEIYSATTRLLENPAAASTRTESAYQVVQSNQGATARLNQSLVNWISSATDPTNS